MRPVLYVKDVYFSYATRLVLRGVSIAAYPGSLTAVLGSMGSGKTTLLLIAAGLLKPERGVVLLDDKPLEELMPDAKRRIGVVFQNPDDQLFTTRVYDEIAYALRTLGLDEEEVRRRVYLIAEKIGVTELLHSSPYSLSMGQKRLVSLASVLVYEPQILLLDEPFVFLDSESTKKLYCVILEHLAKGGTVIMATHDVEKAMLLADHVCLLNEGRASCMARERMIDMIVGDEKLMWRTPLLAELIERVSKGNVELFESVLRETRRRVIEACSQGLERRD